jgi:predicted nucleotidyltransferase
MIDSMIKDDIVHRLKHVEETEHVRILMAIESGSRAWGFASPNSDYDIRFIYVREPDWYLSVDLEDRRDVIEYPIVDDIDLNGWDLRKALQLFWKSNPAFVEWIQSPITYIEEGPFRSQVLDLLPEIYSIEKGIYHYRSMAKTNYRGYLKDERVPLKKYFYVLRPLLAIRWLERFGTAAPIEFKTLLDL